MESERRTWTAAMARWWTAIAIVLLNTLVAVALLNVVLAWWFPGQTTSKGLPVTGPLAEYVRTEFLRQRSFASIEKYLPGMDEADVVDLVVETYARPFVYEPFTQFSERPFSSRFVNVSPQGFRLVPEQAPWPPRPGRPVVFVFGGSTTFGAGVPDDVTVPAHLRDLLARTTLGSDVQLYNFGRGHYFSTQERILFEQLLLAGHVPDIAIFVDGLNEFTHADGLPQHTAELRAFLESPTAMCPRPSRALLAELPMTRAGDALVRSLRAPPAAVDWRPPAPTPAEVTATLERYLANVRIADAVAREYGVEALFVWQPVPTWEYDLAFHEFFHPGPAEPPRGCAPGYELMARWRDEGRLPSSLWWCAGIQRTLRRSLYIDQVHYTPAMNRRVASCIAKGLVAKGLTARRRDPATGS